MKRKFEVQYVVCVGLEVDDSLLPDDEWRQNFYDIETMKELAEHFAYNLVANGVDKINRLDGFADRDPELVEFAFREWELEETRVID